MNLKTNILSDLTSTLHLGVEVTVAQHWSIDISGNYNPWEFADYRKQKQWKIQPEGRYWLKKALKGHFFGLHILTGEFNMANPFFPFNLYTQLQENRYEGIFYGAGLAYGYQFVLSPRWSIETEIGIGYIGSQYDQYECIKCGSIRSSGYSNQFALTRLSAALIITLF